MTKLIGISGSLRRGSLNTALLRAAAEFVPNGAELTVETIHGIPLYDADVETADGIPERVSALKEAIVAADGLLLATPEYNNSIPGVFKNALTGSRGRRPTSVRFSAESRWRYSGHRPAALARSSASTHGCQFCGRWGRRPGTADAFSCRR